ncbi:invasion associated locus B family protein [Bombella favorum]|uniref:Invasion associated locus B family protein n=1 Tax=Bombella favorum TaxID=2039164 RepID=A0ABR5ZLX3_9PROT|nr:invasion associated locus B family protein [Bombella favorum]MBA5725315.1 hypothetical protein [Bombella favorum]
MFRRSHAVMAGMAVAGMLSVLPAFAAGSKDNRAAAVEAVTEKGGGLPEIMAAEHPGVAARSAFAGPWRYGCAYPAKGSRQGTQFCTIQLEHMAGTTMDSGFFLLAHATPDLIKKPLAQQPWQISLNLPTRLPFDMKAGLQLSVDNGHAVPLALQSCDETGCMAQKELPAPIVLALASGKTAQLTAKTKTGAPWAYVFQLSDIQMGMQQLAGWLERGELNP